MAEHTVTLSADQEAALTAMGITDLEVYVKAICDNHINQDLDKQLTEKTVAEKQALLNP